MCAICANKAHLWSSDLLIGFQALDLGSLSRRSPGITSGILVGGSPGLLWDGAACTATLQVFIMNHRETYPRLPLHYMGGWTLPCHCGSQAISVELA